MTHQNYVSALKHNCNVMITSLERRALEQFLNWGCWQANKTKQKCPHFQAEVLYARGAAACQLTSKNKEKMVLLSKLLPFQHTVQ